MLNLYNTLNKKVEPVSPQDGKTIRMYTCGPTVYDYAHIGNLRSFIEADLAYRTLRANGQSVEWVMNITDVDDKTIRGAVEKYGPDATVENLKEYTDTYLQAFLEDLEEVQVNVQGIRFIRVSEAIPAIQDFIVELMDKGFAYQAEDGSIYFSIEKYQEQFHDYGILVGERFLEGKKVGARVKVDEYDKDNLSDFALWKAWSPEEGQIWWEHERLGNGRPGWHIECSAINRMAFGANPTDLHTGGIDLAFPHHTNEIAQSKPLGPFVRHWMHVEHLMVDGKKMAKSSQNFFTLRDIKEKGFTGTDLRYTFLQSGYRTQQNFTWDSIAASRSALNKMTKLISSLEPEFWKTDSTTLELLNKDLSSSEALANAWAKSDSTFIYCAVVLGLPLSNPVKITPEVESLLDQRRIAREQEDFARSDTLRKQIEDMGYELQDTPNGQVLNKP